MTGFLREQEKIACSKKAMVLKKCKNLLIFASYSSLALNLEINTLFTKVIPNFCWLHIMLVFKIKQNAFSWVFLLRQLWLVNYYVKGLLNNLSNENIKPLVFPEKLYFKNSSFWHFNSRFIPKKTKTPVFMFSLLRLFDQLST